MKILFTFFLLTAISWSQAQTDTTANRLISINDSGILVAYKNDTSVYYGAFPQNITSGHALFMNPDDNLIYAVVDITGGDRNLYTYDPFSAELTLVHDFADGFIHTADIGNNGMVYAVTGNGSSTPGLVYTLNLSTGIESPLYVSASGTSGLSRAIEFNPTDSSLYIYQGDSDELYIYNLATGIETMVSTTGLNDELHGAYYKADLDVFLLTSYNDILYTTDQTYINGSQTVYDIYTMDLTDFKMLDTYTDVTTICTSDSVNIALLYTDSVTWTWYKDGTPLPNTSSSLWVSDQGIYKALIKRVQTGTDYYFWTEPFKVNNFAEPQVVLSQVDNDTTICPNETVVITGANGGILQWYRNGVLLAGETNNTLAATSAGSYNQTKVNMSGCFGTSEVPYILYDDNCGLDVTAQKHITGVTIYPNPAEETIAIQLDGKIESVSILDLTGALVHRVEGNIFSNQLISVQGLPAGVYVVTIETETAFFSERLIKK
ncbi:MAG: T9SS type A sorting domain-containing protein [Putridiphycobacter sp.]|nr:T9SS type A sorting domain-containing protein [Putridiphycobacter sp.]